MAPISLKRGYINELAGTLIKHTIDVENEDDDNFKAALQFLMSNFRFHRFLDVNPQDVDRKVDGLVSKFRVYSYEDKADNLKRLINKFLNHPLLENEDRGEKLLLKTNAHYSLLSLLFNLSDSPLHVLYEPKSKIGKSKEEIKVDWVAYLLDGEVSSEVGLQINPLAKRYLENSDDEDWQLTDEEEYQLESNEMNQLDEKIGDLSKKLISPDQVMKKTFEDSTWLKENVVQSYWQNTEIESLDIGDYQYSKGSNSMCTNWEISKMKSCHRKSISDKKLITEKVLVRETLWMLQGIKELHVYPFKDGKYNVNQNIVLNHLTHETLLQYLTSFTQIGNQVSELKNYIDTATSGDGSYTKTFCAFGFGIGRYLTERNCTLAKLEKDIIENDHTVTLSVLKEELANDSSKIVCIHELYRAGVVADRELFSDITEQLVHFFDVFYQSLLSFDALGNAGIDKIVIILSIFLDACLPYLDDIDHWMTTGELPYNNDNEFFVIKANTIKRGESNYWRETFKIKEKVSGSVSTPLVPDFIKPISKQILLAGKSLGLLQEFGNFTATVLSSESLFREFQYNLRKVLQEGNGKLKMSMDETDALVAKSDTAFIEDESVNLLLRENFKNMFLDGYLKMKKRKAFEKQENKDINMGRQEDEHWHHLLKDGSLRAPLALLIEKSLHPLIHSRYNRACAVLLDLLKKEFKLFFHIEVMKNFWLMEAGGTIHMFYSELYLKAKMKEIWQNVPYLNIALQDALQMHYPWLMDSLTVELDMDFIPQNKGAVFDGLSLKYSAPWPISIILDADAEKQYNEIFKFMLKMKRSTWCLEQLRFDELNNLTIFPTGLDNAMELPVASKSPMPLNQKQLEIRQLMLILRMKMCHVLRMFNFYLMDRVKFITIKEFQTKFEEAKDLDELLEVHQAFLTNLHHRCFLGSKIGPAKDAIHRIFCLALDFQDLWVLGVAQIDAKKIESLEIEFKRCKSFLFSFFNNLAKRGSYPHFEFLTASLKTESHSHLALFRR